MTPLPEPGVDVEHTAPPTLRPIFAVLRGLDKVTGRADTFEVRVGGVAQFGRLTVSVKACNGRAPDEPPESAGFLQIRDTTAGPDAAPLFSGWMFASSPGLSAMDHARYDIWILNCRSESP